MVKIQFNKNFGVKVYQELGKSKSISRVYRINHGILRIEDNDLPEVRKVFKRLILNYKVI
jgi:hypothetical protein